MFDCLGRNRARLSCCRRNRRRRVRALLVLLVLALSLTHASAQTAVEGIIRGIAVDESAAAVAGCRRSVRRTQAAVSSLQQTAMRTAASSSHICPPECMPSPSLRRDSPRSRSIAWP